MPQVGGGSAGSLQQPVAPGTTAAAGLQASPSWQNQVAGDLAGGYDATIAGYGLSSALGSQQLGLDSAGMAVQGAELTNSAGFDMAGALLGEQGLGLQAGALGESAATNAAQQAIEQQSYGVSSTQYPEQLQEAALQNTNTLEQMSSSGAGAGTLNTTGHGQAQQTQASEYGWQKADIFRAQQLAALGQQSEEVGYAGQQQQTASQEAQLGLAAKSQGLTAQQAAAQLGFGMQQLGVSGQPEQFLNAITSAQGEGAQQLSALGSQASLIGGLGANFGQGG